MNPFWRSVLLAAITSSAMSFRAGAQEPASQGVKSSATVEVLDDTAHVDDVISQMKRPPQAKSSDVAPNAKTNLPTVQSLKGERPDLQKEVNEQEKRTPGGVKDDKHASWRWQRALEERAEHVRKARNQ